MKITGEINIPGWIGNNSFLKLVYVSKDSMYSVEEIKERALKLDNEQIFCRLVSGLQLAAKEHVENRFKAIVKRGIRKYGKSDNFELLVEALCDSHFRRQKNKGCSPEEIKLIVRPGYVKKEKLNLIGLMFTRKNISPLKTHGHGEEFPDLAEIISLIHLNSFVELIKKFYPGEVNLIILSEGKRYSTVFGYSTDKSDSYIDNLRKYIHELGLNQLIVEDYEDFIQKHFPKKTQIQRKIQYQKVLSEFRSKMESVLNPNELEKSVERAISLDPRVGSDNPEGGFIPIWRSILCSLPYLKLKTYSKEHGIDFQQFFVSIIKTLHCVSQDPETEYLRNYVIRESWLAAIKYYVSNMVDSGFRDIPEKALGPNTLRTTVNPKNGKQLGIYTNRLITSITLPWHGTCFLDIDASNRISTTVLTRFELEIKKFTPVYIVSEYPVCYVTDKVTKMLLVRKNLVFNMSTRI